MTPTGSPAPKAPTAGGAASGADRDRANADVIRGKAPVRATEGLDRHSGAVDRAAAESSPAGESAESVAGPACEPLCLPRQRLKRGPAWRAACRAAPLSPAGVVASIQGRLITLLDTLLQKEVVVPKPVTPPALTTVYRGSDAKLIRLQTEIIESALEALGTPPLGKPK